MREESDYQMRSLAGLPTDAALVSLRVLEDMEEVKMFQDFSIPDNILKQFLSSHPIHLLFQNQDRFDQKTYLEYTYNDVTYTSTIYNYHYGLTGNRQLTIKLSHDGFRYAKRAFKRSHVSWHRSGEFFILADMILDEMPFLKSFKQQHAKILFYYSIKDRRMDIRLKKEGQGNYLMFTFEPGKPTFIEDDSLYI